MEPHDFLATLAVKFFGVLSDALTGLLGTNAQKIVWGDISGVQLAAVLTILLLTLCAHVAVGIFVHSRAKVAQEDQKETKHDVFKATTKPLYLLLWIFGFYFAVAPLLGKLPTDAAVLRAILDKVLDLGIFLAAIWFSIRLTWILQAKLAGWAAKTRTRLDDILVPLIGRIIRIIIPILGIILFLPILGLPPRYADALAKCSSIMFIVAVAVILFACVDAGQKVFLAESDLTKEDNLQARKIYTQVNLLGKVAHVVIGLCTVAVILMLFQQVRHVGTSLLASAGIAGIIAGIAAQQTLANLFAGFQIAMAQPIRQSDVVVVEGEWGTIEEITLTYVVVHIWDDRRLVLPLSYFIQKPFQNWTRSSARLLGSIFVWVDYTFPVEDGRKALKPIIENNPLWDKRFWNLQVSDTSEKTIQLRILATSADSSKSWDLRCKIREDFIAYIQKNHPGCLPRIRAELEIQNDSTSLNSTPLRKSET